MSNIIHLTDQELIAALDYIKDTQRKDDEQIIRDMQHQINQDKYEQQRGERVRIHY